MEKPEIIIEYCPKCNWMIRAAWLAQEFLMTFENDIKKVSIMPSEKPGDFLIWVNDNLVYNRKVFGGFAEPKVFKQLVRDVISPAKDLGHADKKH